MALELQRIDPWDGDSSTGTTYYGYAQAGTQDLDPKWNITKKTVVDGVLVYQYPYITGTRSIEANPSIAIDNQAYMKLSGLVWADRAIYTYK